MKLHPVISGILIAVCSASLGFGASQATMGNQVRANSTEIVNLKDAFKLEQARTDQRIFKLADLVTTSVTHTEKLFSTIEAQSKLIQSLYERLDKQAKP